MPPPEPVKLYDLPTEQPARQWRKLRKDYGDAVPVLFDPDTPGWVVLSYEENRRVLKDDSLFSADPNNWRDMREGRIPAESGIAVQLIRRHSARCRDGAEHKRYRNAIQDALQRLIDEKHMLHAVVREVSYQLIRDLARQGHADLISQYARPLAGIVLARLVGFSAEEAEHIGTVMQTIWDGEPVAAQQAWHHLAQQLYELTSRRLHAPQTDVVSLLLHDQTRAHSVEEAADQVALLFAAGYDTTTHLVGNCLQELLTDGRMRKDLLSAGADVESVIDTVQVSNPPLAVLPGRWPTADCTVGSYRLRQGDLVALGIVSANLDLAPTQRDLALSTRAHLGWGAGAHHCPRAARGIATEVASTGISCLVNAAPLRLAVRPDQLRRRASLTINGNQRLPASIEADHLTLPAGGPPRPAPPAPRPVAQAVPRQRSSVGEWLGAVARMLVGRG